MLDSQPFTCSHVGRLYIKPSVKDVKGDITCSDNYREIMMSNNMFKIFEYALLNDLKKFINLSPYQFGHRTATNTTMAVALLKETINRYITEGSAVYACFLDLRMAFQSVTHDKLLNKLSDRHVPEYLIKLLRVMFTNYCSVSVMYNNVMSNKWSIK